MFKLLRFATLLLFFCEIHGEYLSTDSGDEVADESARDLQYQLGPLVLIAPTASPYPTSTPLPSAPTFMPTESPAPSPSPTFVPSFSPTGSPGPTYVESSSPTESPAPSPSPSAQPSFMPSFRPSEAPSVSPSAAPSDVPSVSPSQVPSMVPSQSPSDQPSAAPSLSLAPSSTPSDVPSVPPSAAPSAAPSNAPSISAAPSDQPSGAPSERPSQQPSDSPSAAPSTSMAPSSVPSRAPTNMPSTSPSEAPSFSPSVSLLPSMSPSQHPTPGPTRFNTALATVVTTTFPNIDTNITGDALAFLQSETQKFIQLRTADAVDGHELEIASVIVIEQMLIPDRRRIDRSTRRRLHDSGWRVRMNVTGMLFPGDPPDDFSFTQIVAATLSTGFMDYMTQLSTGHEFFRDVAVGSSPDALVGNRNVSNDVGAGQTAAIILGSLAALTVAAVSAFYAVRHRDVVRARSVGSRSSRDDDVNMLDHCDSHSTAMSPREYHLNSPNTLEAGKAGDTSTIMSYSHASVGSKSTLVGKSLLDTVPSGGAEEEKVEETRENLGFQFCGTVIGTHTRKSDPPVAVSNRKVDPDSQSPMFGFFPNTFRRFSSGYLSPAQSQSPGPTDAKGLDTVEVPDSPASQTSSISSFAHLLNAPSSDGEGTLGARPMGQSEHNQYRESHSSDGVPSLKRQGLYDVFAPPGPLGIVVDTSKDGPIVHALKPNSPLLGLISPGDLIVGLDDKDTRSMTAATLTRTMAKRAKRSDRKITLLAVEAD